jgi:hypothetical protein
MELQRKRSVATTQIVLAVLLVGVQALSLSRGPDTPVIHWVGIAVAFALASVAWRLHRSASRALRAFEVEHGTGAGLQEPLR